MLLLAEYPKYSMIFRYGYYSAEWEVDEGHGGIDSTLGEAGEGLTVADPEEVWIFHILPDPTGASAIWVAQRIPPNHITVISNSFVILDVLENDENFLYSDNLFDVAESQGWWSRKSNQPLNFAKVSFVSTC